MAEQRVRGLSLRRKVTGWLGAILAVDAGVHRDGYRCGAVDQHRL